MNAPAFVGADQYYVICLLKPAPVRIYGVDGVRLLILENDAYKVGKDRSITLFNGV